MQQQEARRWRTNACSSSGSIRPSSIFSPALAGTGIDAETIRAGLEGDAARLHGMGRQADVPWIGDGPTAEPVLRARRGATRYDAVLIGAGLRTLPPHALLFEALVNAVHEAAPGPGSRSTAIRRTPRKRCSGSVREREGGCGRW